MADTSMTTRDWLLADSPTSRFQANMGRSYRLLLGLVRNPLTLLGIVIVLALILTAIFILAFLRRLQATQAASRRAVKAGV